MCSAQIEEFHQTQFKIDGQVKLLNSGEITKSKIEIVKLKNVIFIQSNISVLFLYHDCLHHNFGKYLMIILFTLTMSDCHIPLSDSNFIQQKCQN